MERGRTPRRREDRGGEWRSGRACVPDFWSRSMIFPKRANEGGGLRMAAMELDLAGGRMANRVARSCGRCGCVFPSLILFSPRLPAPAALFLPLPSLSRFLSPVSRKSTCLSTYAHAIMLYHATEQYPGAPLDLYLTPRDAVDRSVWIRASRPEKI